jgi:lambda repressor-like predicted transcriptional regulator
MESHYGQIVELIIRKNGFNITELARMAGVERRTVYNWFNQKYLKTKIIYRIGCVLKHDFSVEFPTLFTKDDFKDITKEKEFVYHDSTVKNVSDNQVWKGRYITLLEEYNTILLTYANISKKGSLENQSIAEPIPC